MKRFRIQYGLRTLVVLTVICALFMAWVGSLRRQQVDQRNAIREAQVMGASVTESPNLDSGWITFKSWLAGGPLENQVKLSFQHGNPLSSPMWGSYGPGGKTVQIREWNEANIQTLGPIFRRLPGLESISFWKSPLPLGTLEGIIPDSPRIEYLNASVDVGCTPSTEIGPQDFAALSRLPNLKRLNLSSTNVTDDDLVHVAKLDLNLLMLQDTRITDEGIRILADMKNLEAVDLGLTRVTEDIIPILVKWQVKTKLLVPAEWSSAAVADLIYRLPAECEVRKTAYRFRFHPSAKVYREVMGTPTADE